MTNYERIKNMSVDEMAAYFDNDNTFPDTACYLCKYDEGFNCVNPVVCTWQYRENLYKIWLESEAKYD